MLRWESRTARSGFWGQIWVRFGQTPRYAEGLVPPFFLSNDGSSASCKTFVGSSKTMRLLLRKQMGKNELSSCFGALTKEPRYKPPGRLKSCIHTMCRCEIVYNVQCAHELACVQDRHDFWVSPMSCCVNVTNACSKIRVDILRLTLRNDCSAVSSQS